MRQLPIIALLGITLSILGILLFRIIASTNTNIVPLVSPLALSRAPKPTPQPTVDPLRPITILALGYGGAQHEGGGLADTIILIHIVLRKKQVFMISIPRDLWVKLPIPNQNYHDKVNTSFAASYLSKQFPALVEKYTGSNAGGQLAKDVISEISGLPIDYYAAIDFQGFVSFIDLLGGIDVTVSYPFTDAFYPIEGKKDDACGLSEETITQIEATLSGQLREQAYTCRFETISYSSGIQHMNGQEALKYVRSRHSLTNGGDFARSKRQRDIVSAVRTKILRLGFIAKIPETYKTFRKYVQTDIGLTEILPYTTHIPDISDYSIYSMGLSEDKELQSGVSSLGAYILYPKSGMDNWSSVQESIAAFIKSPK